MTRLADVDNLRTFLTVLVVCHHSAIAFGAAGGWYYVVPPPPGSVAPLVLTLFTGINQAFFMSLFFAVSGYFTGPAFETRGPNAFLKDRLLRLGVPLVAYFFVLNPIVVYLARRFEGGTAQGLVEFLATSAPGAFGTGPLWFVLALLIFSGSYVAVRSMGRRELWRPHPFPSDRRILAFVVGIGLVAFLVRIVFPVGTGVLGLQFGYFPLYIAFFVFGLRARDGDWVSAIDRVRARRWFAAALVAIVAMPAIVIGSGGPAGGKAADFRGGLTALALVYAMWEPILCVGISLRLLVLFREHFAHTGALAARAARSAYTVYILHPFFVVCGTAALAMVPIDPLLRFVLLCLFVTISCFALSDGVRRTPGLRRIL